MPYCTQEDLEIRLSKVVLVQLLSDLKNIVIPSAPRANVIAGGAGVLTAGVYKYRVTFTTAAGDSIDSETSNSVTITAPTTQPSIALSALPIGGTGTTGRKIWRTAADGSTFYLLATVGDNTTVTYTDSIADAVLITGSILAPFIAQGATELIARADALIDAYAGQVYEVPFTSTPKLVKLISVDLSCYYAMQRRYTELEMPKDWMAVFDGARKDLQRIADEELKLDATSAPTVSSKEIQFTSNDQVMTFNDSSSSMSQF